MENQVITYDCLVALVGYVLGDQIFSEYNRANPSFFVEFLKRSWQKTPGKIMHSWWYNCNHDWIISTNVPLYSNSRWRCISISVKRNVYCWRDVCTAITCGPRIVGNLSLSSSQRSKQTTSTLFNLSFFNLIVNHQGFILDNQSLWSHSSLPPPL